MSRGPRHSASPNGRKHIIETDRFSAHVLLLEDYLRNEAGRLRGSRSGRREGVADSQSQRVLWTIWTSQLWAGVLASLKYRPSGFSKPYWQRPKRERCA
jgi:hypothetical protein